MKLKFLGSGCWQGVPGQFCDDTVSKNVEWDTKDFRFRTSLLIETSNGKTIVVEATPDIRLQAWKTRLKCPEAFLISHWHWDHFYGLLDIEWFCEKYRPRIFGNAETKKRYDQDMGIIPLKFEVFESYRSFTIDNVKITPFEVTHVKGTDGFIFEDLDNGEKFAYLADLAGMPDKSLALIKDIKTVITDSIYIGGKAIDNDRTHFWQEDLLEFLKKLNASEIILTHISSIHDLTHAQLEKMYPQYTVAFDGMERQF